MRAVIARVQPLTTTRRLAGPFDYALPDAPVDVGSIVRVPFGRQALDGVVVGLAETTEVPAEKLVTPTAVREDSRARRSSSSSRCGWRTSTARRRRARSRSCCRRAGRPRTELWAGADGRAARRRAADGEPARAARGAAARRGAATSAALRRLEARGLVAIAPRGAPARAAHRRRAPTRAVELTAEQRARGRRGRARRRVAAARRHRLGQDRGLPARGGRGARARARA